MLQCEDGRLLSITSKHRWATNTGMVWGSLDSLADDIKRALSRNTASDQELRKSLLTATILVFAETPFRSLSVVDFMARKGVEIKDFL